jgi:regulator of telomere elongation helicase 1
MHIEEVAGIKVKMPFKPYEAQVRTMEVILRCLENRESGLVESPTGTGKSLSILCACLAWLSQTKNKPRVYVCSRTHKQIDQLIGQLKKLAYTPKTSVLAGRTHMCLNRQVLKETDKNSACRDAVKGEGCMYYTNKEMLARRMNAVFDIEEIRAEGARCKGCPYYASRILADESEVIFSPYNYILDPSIRKNMNIKLEESVVIIDEGHNVEDVCRSAGTLHIEGKTLDVIAIELANLLAGEQKEISFVPIVEALQGVKMYITKGVRESKREEQREEIKGEEIRRELAEMGVTEMSLELLRPALSFLVSEEQLSIPSTQFLESFVSILHGMLTRNINSYGMVRTGTSLVFMCLDAGLIFSQIISQTRSVVLLSGTLIPFDGLSRDLGCGEAKSRFPHRVEAPHVIGKSQLFSACITSAPSGSPLLGTYASMNSEGYLSEVGRVISTITGRLSGIGGVLCFVPSYAFLDRVSVKVKAKYLFREPKGSNKEFEDVLAQFRRVKDKGPVVLLCVYRGRASEGIDFKDAEARAVIAVGIPYPNIKDPGVSMKREYNDKHMGRTGNSWYETQAFRAVNQALGRCIRHRNDWGAIFLLDSRYQEKRALSLVSKWVSKDLNIFKHLEEAEKAFSSFLAPFAKEKGLPGPEKRPLADIPLRKLFRSF